MSNLLSDSTRQSGRSSKQTDRQGVQFLKKRKSIANKVKTSSQLLEGMTNLYKPLITTNKEEQSSLGALADSVYGQLNRFFGAERVGARDPANDQTYSCSDGSTYGTYNAETLTPTQQNWVRSQPSSSAWAASAA